MNLFREALVILPVLFSVVAVLAADVFFDQKDFTSAKTTKSDDGTMVCAHLSKEGLEKIQGYNQTQIVKDIEIYLAGENCILKLREPFKGDEIEFEPFSDRTAQKIVAQLNQ